jgi:hypothetical protein
MKAFRILSAVIAIGLVGAVQGDVAPDKKSTLTIATPLEVPGAILDPGTYVVKLVDTQSNRNIVTITSVDEKKVYATAICTPHVAADDPRHTTFMFYSTPEGANKVLRTWYAPNDRYGQDFVYPADRAAALRQVTNAEVPAMTAEQSTELANRPAPVAVISDAEPPKPIEAPAPPPPAPVVETAPAPAPAIAVETAPAPAPATMTADASETLPKTASKTPLVLAAGILALGVASGLRFAGRS